MSDEITKGSEIPRSRKPNKLKSRPNLASDQTKLQENGEIDAESVWLPFGLTMEDMAMVNDQNQ